MTIKATQDVIIMGDYGAHIYVDPQSEFKFEKEQFYVDKTGKPRLIHPHKYGEKCGNIMHTRMAPHQAPVQVRIIT